MLRSFSSGYGVLRQESEREDIEKSFNFPERLCTKINKEVENIDNLGTGTTNQHEISQKMLLISC